MDKLSRQQFESWVTDYPDMRIDEYAVTEILWQAWQASRSEPVTLPPMLDLEGRTGRSFIIAGAHNSAITLCSMAITGAGYATVCSPLLGNEEPR